MPQPSFFIWTLSPHLLLDTSEEPPMTYPPYMDLDSEFRKRLSLDGEWEFQLDPKEEGLAQQWFRPEKSLSSKIRVPGCWQAQGIGGPEQEGVEFRIP